MRLDDRPGRARGARRRRSTRAGVREPARERPPLLGRPAGGGPASGGAARACWSRRRPGARDRNRPSASGSSSRSTAAARPSGDAWTGSGLWARDRQGVRRGQRRHDRGRVAARSGHELRRLAADRRSAEWSQPAMSTARQAPRPRVLVCDDEHADPAGAAGDPARRRLRVAAGLAPARRRSTSPPCSIPTRRSSTCVLPDIDGIELCRRLREWTRYAADRALGGRRRGRQGAGAGRRRRRLRDQAVRPAGAVARLEANCAGSSPTPRRRRSESTGSRSTSPAARSALERRRRST